MVYDPASANLAAQQKFGFQGKPEDFMNEGGGIDWNAYIAASNAWDAQNANNRLGYQKQLDAEFQDSQNPWVTVSGTVKGAPGVSIRKSDYDTELAKYQQQNPGANTSDPSFGVTFANWLRNSNAPTSTNPRGTYLGQTSPGLNISNADAVKKSQDFIDAENAAEFKPGKAIVNLSRGLVASGFGAAALGGLGPLSAIGETGVSAGNAASNSGGLSSLFSNFSTSGALKSAAGSGISSLVSGDGIEGALRGAAIGGLTGGFAPAISKAVDLSGAPAKALEGAITGAAGGAASGGAKSAITRGLLSGLGDYISGGGEVPGLGNLEGYTLPEGVQGPVRAGTGILGTVQKGINSLGLSGGGNSSMLGGIGNAISGVAGYGALNESEDDIIEARRKAAAQLQPYQAAGNNALGQLSASLQAGFDPSKIESDKGYQFNVGQANKALDRASSARGNFYSGAALKDAAKYGSDIANTYTNDYFNRWVNTNNQLAGVANTGYNASSNIGNILAGIGDTKANANVGRNNLLSQILSSFL